jgi:hypothetical protein
MKMILLLFSMVLLSQPIMGEMEAKKRPMTTMEFSEKYAFNQAMVMNKSVFVGFKVYENEQAVVRMSKYESTDGLYKAWMLVGYDKRKPIPWNVLYQGMAIEPLVEVDCVSMSDKKVKKCAFLEMRFTKPQPTNIYVKPKKKVVHPISYEFITVNHHDYIDKAIDLPATVYGLGEYMCGDIGKPKKCAAGAKTASGETLHPMSVMSAAIPAPTNLKMKVSHIEIKVNGGKCVSVRINDKANPRWIGRRGLDLTPVVIHSSTGVWPSRHWKGKVERCPI